MLRNSITAFTFVHPLVLKQDRDGKAACFALSQSNTLLPQHQALPFSPLSVFLPHRPSLLDTVGCKAALTAEDLDVSCTLS